MLAEYKHAYRPVDSIINLHSKVYFERMKLVMENTEFDPKNYSVWNVPFQAVFVMILKFIYINHILKQLQILSNFHDSFLIL